MARARSDSLVIHACGRDWPWLALDRSGAVVDRGQASNDTPDWPADRSALVLVDASRCLGLTLDLPPLRGQRLRQALRWAAEEHLAGSAEDEHVVPGPRDAEGRLYCVSVGNATMDEIMARLGDLAPERLVPDALCLPWQPGQIGLAEHEGRILVRWGEWSFAGFDRELAADMIASVAQPEAEWIWYGGDMPDWLAQSDPADGAAGRPLLQVLAERARSVPVNLLSGPWAPRSAAAAHTRWRWVAVLAAVLVVGSLMTAAVERWQLAARADSLETAIEAQFREAFPDVGRIVRPQAQAERELARLRFGQAAGLLDLMHRVAPVIDGQPDLLVDRIDYRNGVLELGLRAPDVAALDELEQRLRALQLSAEVQSASLDDEGATGRIRVAERGDA